MKILVLFDGHCQLCRNSIAVFTSLDWVQKLQPVDFRDAAIRERYAPEIPLENLDRAMHIKIGQRRLKGFDAFRYICWHIPLLLPLAPFLYFPGVAPIGRKIYADIAKKRKVCADGVCSHKRN